MPDPDLTLELSDARDEVIPERGGVYRSVKRYTFYLGKFGPFVERIPIESTDGYELQARIEKLRAHAARAAPLGRPAGALMLHPRPLPRRARPARPCRRRGRCGPRSPWSSRCACGRRPCSAPGTPATARRRCN
jgi:hypothetical protein